MSKAVAPTLPDWISVTSHASISPYWKALCTRCQDRCVDKLLVCKAWTIEHAENCKGATCDHCQTVFPGRSWDMCPTCGESADLGNRIIDGRQAGQNDFERGLPYYEPAERTEPFRKAHRKGYLSAQESHAKRWCDSPSMHAMRKAAALEITLSHFYDLEWGRR